MAYDAGMAWAICRELSEVFSGAKIEKIYQPSDDEILLLCRTRSGSRKLLLSASASSARVCATALVRENPKMPPMFCMQLRKHLTGALITEIKLHGFERVIEIEFSAFDEMGFACRKFIEAEIMGKCSNLVFAEERSGSKRVLGALKSVDFTTSSKRQVLPGMVYELPPAQDKTNPLTETDEHFRTMFAAYPKERAAEKFILDTYQGLSPLAAREIAFCAGALGIPLADMARSDGLWRSLAAFRDGILAGKCMPVMLARGAGAKSEPFEYCFFDVCQYGDTVEKTVFPDLSSLLDAYFGARDRAAVMRSRSHDIMAAIGTVRHKLSKKIPQLHAELEACEEMDTFKLWGDLVTASIYMLQKKTAFCEVTNYYSEELETVRIPLDIKLTPAQNAARYYKKYAKLKTAKTVLTEQIAKAEEELSYLDSVEEAASRAETEDDLSGIRAELFMAGYLSKNGRAAKPKEKPGAGIRMYRTSGGRTFYVGRNNIQNDYLTMKLAGKSDWWFHVKGGHGSHVIMVCAPDEDPDAADFTEVAAAAAYFSGFREGGNVAVDYTQVKNVKKPSGAMPGKVVYYTNYTAYVNPKQPEEKTSLS